MPFPHNTVLLYVNCHSWHHVLDINVLLLRGLWGCNGNYARVVIEISIKTSDVMIFSTSALARVLKVIIHKFWLIFRITTSAEFPLCPSKPRCKHIIVRILKFWQKSHLKYRTGANIRPRKYKSQPILLNQLKCWKLWKSRVF